MSHTHPESGRIFISFLFLFILFVAVAGSTLYFSGKQTGVAVIDGAITSLKSTMSGQLKDEATLASQSGQKSEQDQTIDPASPHSHQDGIRDHAHGANTHTHGAHGDETGVAGSSGMIPGQQGQIYQKDINPILGERSIGNPDAPIQIREFFSLTCNHCASFHAGSYKALKEKYIDTGKVHFIFEEFPLNGPALYGSMIARCLPKERYATFVGLLLEQQDQWAFGGNFKDALKQRAALAGMGDEEFERCYNDRELQKAIAQNIQEVSDIWKISSTPSFVINDGARILSGSHPIEGFEKVMAHLLQDTSFLNPASNFVQEVTPEPFTEMGESLEEEIFEEQELADDMPIETEPSDSPAPVTADGEFDLNDLYAE